VEITANTAGRSLGEVSAEVRRILESTSMPPGYGYRFGGSTKDMQESFAYALSALAMAVIFIYMILASQFRSFMQPVALMSSLPLTLIGVVGALLMFGSTMNLFSIIGVVMLGTLVGSVLPLLFRSIGLDPALMSNPFVSAIVDIVGIVLYTAISLALLG
ncbi:MAG: efflux RND transporter permease subunit, partial [Planctomycetia bacterium]